jgi:hypothetical protein
MTNRALDMRYGIGVGREGFQWQGLLNITRKAEWPDWTPPPEMIARQPYLPGFMAGGPGNPHGIGARLLREYTEQIGLNPAFTIHDLVPLRFFTHSQRSQGDRYALYPREAPWTIRAHELANSVNWSRPAALDKANGSTSAPARAACGHKGVYRSHGLSESLPVAGDRNG